MPVDYSNAGTNRDMPRFLPTGGPVLRQAIEKLGIVAGLTTAEVQALIDASVAAFASAGAFDTVAPTSTEAAVDSVDLTRLDDVRNAVEIGLEIDDSGFSGSLAGEGITTPQLLAEWVDANVIVLP